MAISGRRRPPAATVPVLVLDLDDAETEKVLLTHDPLASLAGVDDARLSELLDRNEIENSAVGELLEKLGRQIDTEGLTVDQPEVTIPSCHQVVVEVADEDQQRAVYERLRGEGFRCRVLTI